MGVLILGLIFIVSVITAFCNVLMALKRGDIGGIIAVLMLIGLGLYIGLGVYFLTWLSTI